MDNLLLISHNVLRWTVVLFGLYAITKAIRGVLFKQDYTANHNLSATLFVASVHLQILLGLLLYVARGWASNLGKMGEAMGDSTTRFWTVEHAFTMILAALLVQIGRTKSKKAVDVAKKHKVAAIFFTIGFILIMLMIPWPFRGEIARPLWP
ncbi:MAG: hypothetical protein RLZZ337_610 [Bacteroidota bacterium]|jgi:Na+-driven multidrug efflux pump